jgi:hypothetical protein
MLQPSIFLFFLSFFVVLGMEHRTWHMLGRCSTTEPLSQPKPSILQSIIWRLLEAEVGARSLQGSHEVKGFS